MDTRQLMQAYPDLFAFFWRLSGSSFFIQTDTEYVVQECSPSFLRLQGWSEKPIGLSISSLFHLSEPGSSFFLTVSQDAETPIPQTFTLVHTGISVRSYAFEIAQGYLIFCDRLGSSENEILESMSHLNNELTNVSRELSKKNRELERANARIKELSRADELTGLANRRYFKERLEEAVSLATRHHQSLCLLMADLDFFKHINDTYGHDVGDEVLKRFGRVLLESTRKEDLPARYGGEEFIVLLPETGTKEALALGDRLREKLRDQDVLEQETVTVSIGVTGFIPGWTENQLISSADQALYRAKREGRDRCVLAE